MANRPTKIRYAESVIPEVRSAIEPHLLKWEFLIPAWCHEVNVTWQDDDANGALSTVVHYEYRRVDLNILPNFLSCEDRRERNVVHELLHIVTEPLQNTCKDMRDALVKQVPELEGWATEMIRHSDECVTCDLAAILFDRRAQNG